MLACDGIVASYVTGCFPVQIVQFKSERVFNILTLVQLEIPQITVLLAIFRYFFETIVALNFYICICIPFYIRPAL